MIGEGSIHNKQIYLATKALGVSVLRSRIMSNNIANVDTPGYKRKTVNFEAELNRVMAKDQLADVYPAKTNDARHISFYDRKDYKDVEPSVFTEFDTNYRNDKNNVDIDREMTDLTTNSLYYNAVSQALNNSFRRMKTVLA